jgi:DNA-binding transcriptional ArsR family regulator
MVKYPARARVFEALGDPTRLAMVEMLLQKERPVSELAEPFAISLPATLKHLRVLEDAGLASSKKVGRTRMCSLNPVPFDELRDWASMVRAAWNRRLDFLEQLLAETDPES